MKHRSLNALVLLVTITFFLSLHLSQAAGRAVATEAIGVSAALNDSARPAASTPLHITFALTNISSAAAAEYVNSLTDPTSSNYHKWITPQQFGAKFGASSSDIAAVVNYLSRLGMFNISVWPDRQFVTGTLPRSSAEADFDVAIHGYNRTAAQIAQGYNRTYYAPDREPTVDSSVADKIQSIFGLSSAVQALPADHSSGRTSDASSQGFFQPADLANAYNITALHNLGLEGQGETVAIFSPTAFQQSDITRFLTAQGLSSAKLNIVNVTGLNGVSGNTDLTNQIEACIDIETVLGQAPAATVNVYEAPNDGGFEIYQQVEKDNPNILSESYGIDENEVNAAYASSYESIRQAMAAEGITIFVASGDNGAFDGVNQTVVTTSVDASSNYVTAVGGTELSPLKNSAWNGEVAWSYKDGTTGGNSGSGGGLSRYFTRPTWQTGIGVVNSSSNGMRQVPDVAALASSPYYYISTEGGWSGWGGTSCACPLWAGAISLIEQSQATRLGNINPQLYAAAALNPSPFHDITSGNDGLYSCTSGWDFVTGWGSVDFGKLLTALSGSASAITSFTPTSGAPGTSVTITGTGLSHAVTVAFHGVGATSVLSNSATQIVVAVPTGAASGPISLVTPQGSATSSTAFTVLAPFVVTASTTSLSDPEGSQATTSISLANNTIPTTPVALSVSGLPSGITAAFSPNAITGHASSTLTIYAAATVPAGVYNVVVTGTGGQAVSSTQVQVTVTSKPVLSSISVSPATASIVSGKQQLFTATAKDQFGNTLASQPSFSWNTTGGGSISSSGLFTASSVGNGYSVSASAGGLKGSATIAVTGPPTFTISLSPTTVSLSQGSSGSTTMTVTPVNGFTGSIAIAASGLPSSISVAFTPSGNNGILTFTASPTTNAQNYSIALVGTSGTIKTTATLNLVVAARPIVTSISVSPSSALIASGTIQQFVATAKDQFGRPISAQQPFTWSSGGGGAINSTTGQFAASAVGGPYTITASTSGVRGTATVSVSPPPSFTLIASPASLTIKQGTSSYSGISLNNLNGFKASVSLAIGGLPTGLTASLSTATISDSSSSKLTFNAAALTSPGTYKLTVNGTSGSLNESTTVSVTVTKK